MKWSTTAAVFTGALALLAWPAASQSLTEAAAKEKERRAKAKPGKTYTVRELASAGSEGATGDGAPTSDASPKPGASPAAPTPEQELAKKQDEWRKRRDKVAADSAIWSEEAARIQTQLNDNTTSLYGPGRQQAMTALDEAKAKVTELQQQLAALDDEGRRNRYR